MCITFFNIDKDPNDNFPYKLFLLFNREEDMSRPTKKLAQWEDDPNIIGGRDLTAKGTWLGLNVKTGNIAILTNLHKGWLYLYKVRNEKFMSRGTVTHEFLKSSFFSDRSCDENE